MALVLAAPVAYLLPVTRRVLKAGHTRADIVHALSTDLDRQREELAFQFGQDASPTGGIAAHRYQRRRDLVGERWRRFWKSRLGEWAARLAGLGLKPLPASATDRLFESLPEAARKALEDLPEAIRRLELQTQGIRTWIGELETSGARDRATSDRELVKTHNRAQRRLAETETALEAIRLQLLRLHDGTSTVENLRAELSAARKISEAVDRLLEGRRQIRDPLDQRSVASTG